MKKVLAAILLAIGGMMAGTGALAQVQMDVYFTANAMERETAERLMELTRRRFRRPSGIADRPKTKKAIFAR